MIICNGVNIKSRKSLIYFIKSNDVHSFSGDLEKIFKINYFIENKIKFINLLKRSIFKIETFILFVNSNNFNDNSFDEERLKNFIEYVQRNPKDRMSDDYHLLRFGFINDNHRNKYGLSLDKFIRRYGKEVGEFKHKEYSELQKKKSRYSVDYWMSKGHSEIDSYEILRKLQGSHTKKHLKDKSKEYIENYHNINSPWRVEYYLNRGYNEIEAKEIISKLKKESSMFCPEYYQKLGYPIEESKNLSYEYWKDNCYKNNSNVSKESLKLFSIVYDRIKNLDMCVYFGDSNIGKKEYFLYDKNESRYYFYDFTILKGDIKLIIEYNGFKYHPRKEKLTEEEWKNWKCLFNEGVDAETKYKYDCKKRDLALSNGFQYLEIWSDDDFDSNIKKSIDFISSFLNKHFKNYNYN